MYAEIQQIEKLSPHLSRIVLGGGTLDQFESSNATDAYINARFIPEGSPVTVPFDPRGLDGVAAEHLPKPRRFTIRRWDPADQTLAIDFVVHGDEGYAGSWAQRAQPGDRLQFEGPGGSYRPSPDVDWHLLVGDESAFGAIGASLESLSSAQRARVYALVERPGYEIDFPCTADVEVTWVYRDNGADQDRVLEEAVMAATLPDGTFDVFVHGEASQVRAVRRHLISDRGVDASASSISAYWRRRHTDEDWRKIKREWTAEQARDV
ncbi:MAG: siderophore-interacting protein [Ilumatobacter sp.]